MADERDTGGHISKEHALDPNSRDAKEAESDFNSLLDRLFREINQKVPSVAPAQFRALVRQHCQAVIVSQSRKASTLPPFA